MRRAVQTGLAGLVAVALAGPVAADELVTAGPRQPALVVGVAIATPAPALRTLRLIGTVEAAASHPAAFRVGGRIVEIAVETGDRVAAGQVLARLDDTQAQAQLRSARATLEASEAGLAQARAAAERAAALLARAVGTEAQRDDADEALLTAEASRRQAQAQLEVAQQAVEDCVIRASRPAEVIARSAEVGAIVGAGQAVLVLASATEREALFLLPDVAGLGRLEGAEVSLAPSSGGASFPAQVSEVSPVLTAAGTVAVRARFPVAAAGSPPLGATVAGEIRVPRPRLLEVPWTALTSDANGPAVWMIRPEDDRVQLAPITIGAFSDSSVGVAAGLDAGARVVGAGSQDLFPGRAVAEADGQ